MVLPVWAAALHDPAMAAIARQALGSFRARLVDALTRMHNLGRIPPDTDLQAVGAAVLALLPGFFVQHLLLGDVTAQNLRTRPVPAARTRDALTPSAPTPAQRVGPKGPTGSGNSPIAMSPERPLGDGRTPERVSFAGGGPDSSRL